MYGAILKNLLTIALVGSRLLLSQQYSLLLFIIDFKYYPTTYITDTRPEHQTPVLKRKVHVPKFLENMTV